MTGLKEKIYKLKVGEQLANVEFDLEDVLLLFQDRKWVDRLILTCKLNKDVTYRAWNGVHPYDTNLTIEKVPSGQVLRLTYVSRLGDLCCSVNLDRDRGYDFRGIKVSEVSELNVFRLG